MTDASVFVFSTSFALVALILPFRFHEMPHWLSDALILIGIAGMVGSAGRAALRYRLIGAFALGLSRYISMPSAALLASRKLRRHPWGIEISRETGDDRQRIQERFAGSIAGHDVPVYARETAGAPLSMLSPATIRYSHFTSGGARLEDPMTHTVYRDLRVKRGDLPAYFAAAKKILEQANPFRER